MKTFKMLFLALTLVSMLLVGTSYGAFPKKPIKLIVYTKPGGAIDVFARKFQKIAKKYTDTTFVVVNKTGAGGVVAMKHVLSKRADGYMLAAVTRSNIGKMVSSKSNLKVDQFNWMAMMVSDPEAVITNRNQAINTWAQIVADAKAKGGNQLWVGPAAGGNDHIMALKTWQKAGIKAKWIPYGSGGKAMAALMGGHGVAYVGNPGDVIGKPDLKVAAISSKNRLTGKFANVPTFTELGIKNHDSEIMWRGFMTKKRNSGRSTNFL
jgi:tripartite-type tricarboxylate transporter receptor subunit TctC